MSDLDERIVHLEDWRRAKSKKLAAKARVETMVSELIVFIDAAIREAAFHASDATSRLIDGTTTFESRGSCHSSSSRSRIR